MQDLSAKPVYVNISGSLYLYQNLPLLSFYSITSFSSLILMLLFLALLLPSSWILSSVGRLLSFIPLCKAPFVLVRLWMWILLQFSAQWIARTHSPLKSKRSKRKRSNCGIGPTKPGRPKKVSRIRAWTHLAAVVESLFLHMDEWSRSHEEPEKPIPRTGEDMWVWCILKKNL